MASAAPIHLETAQGRFQLRRYPARPGEPLQAWCGADLLLADAWRSRQVDRAATLVVNDEHGALSTIIVPAALWTDSALAATAARQNLRRNQRSQVPVIWSTRPPPAGLKLVLLRIPKQLAYFEHQLAVLQSVLRPGAELVCSGMDKHLSPHTADMLERYFGPVTRHRGARKARLFTAQANAIPAKPVPAPSSYFCQPLDAELHGHANVFSRDRLDMGSRFLMEQLATCSRVESLADLACGNGVLGLFAHRLGLCSQLTFCDESAMALESSRENAARLLPDTADIRFFHGDGLLDAPGPFDLILCNPPFHLGHTVDDFAGRRLLRQCADQLRPGGELYLVANQHLPYENTLRRHFGQVEQVARDRKFVIWRAGAVD